MAEILGISFGWILVVLGTIFLLVEAATPGFFIAVPATVMIILGILLLLGMDIFSSGLGILVAVSITIIVSLLTICLYQRLTPEGIPPVTVSRDSLVGMEGKVIRKVEPSSISGKVAIGEQEWSARSERDVIPKGARVRVIRSEGVHIVVEEVR
ncbi:MAG: NfeD family protein [Methanomicrobiales archaeon]|nr:NfeD family protein [Methanomicrobiales archaeon]